MPDIKRIIFLHEKYALADSAGPSRRPTGNSTCRANPRRQPSPRPPSPLRARAGSTPSLNRTPMSTWPAPSPTRSGDIGKTTPPSSGIVLSGSDVYVSGNPIIDTVDWSGYWKQAVYWNNGAILLTLPAGEIIPNCVAVLGK